MNTSNGVIFAISLILLVSGCASSTPHGPANRSNDSDSTDRCWLSGAVRCSASHHGLERCNGSIWNYKTCEYGCRNDSCRFSPIYDEDEIENVKETAKLLANASADMFLNANYSVFHYRDYRIGRLHNVSTPNESLSIITPFASAVIGVRDRLIKYDEIEDEGIRNVLGSNEFTVLLRVKWPTCFFERDELRMVIKKMDLIYRGTVSDLDNHYETSPLAGLGECSTTVAAAFSAFDELFNSTVAVVTVFDEKEIRFADVDLGRFR